MWNGYDCRNVTTAGAQKGGIEKTREKMVGRGVLLDVARAMGKKWLPDGFAITNEILDFTEKKQGVRVRRGDYLLVHTGHVERCLTSKSWDGYSGGDAPGFAFETVDWLHKREIAGVATDTWGAEVRPNETEDTNQPWHWITIPIMGLTVGEIFHLDRSREGLRGGQALRVPVRRAGAADHRGGGLAGESARDQVAQGVRETRPVEGPKDDKNDASCPAAC